MPRLQTHSVEVNSPSGPKTYDFHFHPTWHAWLTEAGLLGDKFTELMQILEAEERLNNETLWPKREQWFAAFRDDPTKIRVVIIGQDPYPTPGKATGFSFEIAPGHQVDKSLERILQSIRDEQQSPKVRINTASGDLSLWRQRGVFLLNVGLTVCESKLRTVIDRDTKKKKEEKKPKSHLGRWKFFTHGVIKLLCVKSPKPLVFMLWGLPSTRLHTKAQLIGAEHQVLMSFHPSDQGEISPKRADSTLERFSETRHFADANLFLQEKSVEPIDWSNIA